MSAVPGSYGEPLTRREYETVRLQALGYTMPEIALQWGIRTQTVKNHVVNVHRKLGVNTTVEAFRVLGWLRAPEVGAALPKTTGSQPGRCCA